MFVRFIKDSKKFKKGTIIKCSSIHGNMLVKKGFAVPEQKCYQIKDLYIAQIISVNKTLAGLGVTDYVPKDYSIFLYNENTSFLSDSQERGTFYQVLTGKDYFPSNHKDCQDFSKGLEVVRKSSLIHYSTFFYADMHAKGLTENSYVSARDLVYNEYRVRTKMQNLLSKKQDDCVDYCN